LALKCIGRYLKKTSDRGMVMNPSTDICKIDAYLDADFAGMYGHEKPTDPSCVKSCSGFVITFADVPILWQSKLQTDSVYYGGQNHSISGLLQGIVSNY
jgi:hypothetical protein